MPRLLLEEYSTAMMRYITSDVCTFASVHNLQVNADIKKYTVDSDGVPRLFSVDKTTVGQKISTKLVGSWRRDDITHLVGAS